MLNKIGRYSFVAGVVLVLLIGLDIPAVRSASPVLWSFLVILGLVVGFTNISDKDAKEFLWVAVAFVIIIYIGSPKIDTWNNVYLIGQYLKGILDGVIAFILPASIVVGLKYLWKLAKGSH